MQYSATPAAAFDRGLAPVGSMVGGDVVTDRSATAYLLATGEWVSFDRVHGHPASAEGLVTFADGSRYVGRAK